MERWRSIPGFEEQYEVSDFGNVRSLDVARYVAPTHIAKGFTKHIKGKLLKVSPKRDRKGKVITVRVSLRRDGQYHHFGVHCLVLEAFVGPRPDGHYGCHIDDQPINNKLNNLYWGTPTQNCADKIRHGNQQRGSEIPWSKLTEDDVRDIRARAPQTTRTALAEEYGVGQSQISRIVLRYQWQSI